MPELDAQNTSGLMQSFVVMAAVLGLMAVAGIAIDRTLERNDPRRALARNVLLYGGTALFLILVLLLR
jgi:hypothetical protein